jgi:hypothetical protein
MNYSKVATSGAVFLVLGSLLQSAEADVLKVTLNEEGYAPKTFTSADPGALFTLSDYSYGSYTHISLSATDEDYGHGAPELVGSIESLRGKSGIGPNDKLAITVQESVIGSFLTDKVAFAGGDKLAKLWRIDESGSFRQGSEKGSASVLYVGNRRNHPVARGSDGPVTLDFAYPQDSWITLTERFTIVPKAHVAGTDVSGQEISSTLAGGVPEPSTWALMLLGFVGVGYLGMRRQQAIFS